VLALLFLASETNSADNPGFFDPDGYYFPAQETLIGSYHLEWFELSTLDHSGDYEKPRLLTPTARVHFKNRKNDQLLFHDCPQPVITANRLHLQCPAIPLGILTIEGVFLDKGGQYWNRSDIKPMETVVLNARVIVKKNGKLVYSKDHTFTYWEGD